MVARKRLAPTRVHYPHHHGRARGTQLWLEAPAALPRFSFSARKAGQGLVDLSARSRKPSVTPALTDADRRAIADILASVTVEGDRYPAHLQARVGR
ncbi:hypothetical protein GCM10007857_00020 [Bradyrhizobium iriomotense]|uniref:Uncharacterized protein n=1 Tax=Bradyrhizobium iriomotense TaxID=441950 RepID=A0ABQ6AM11_9BRAD|nr:hypothetical protein GCM10007857_00020 [Bradyrhizobium iriomotense]